MLTRSPFLVRSAKTLLDTVPVHRLLRPVYGGDGVIFVMHRVLPPVATPRIVANARLEIAPAFLEAVIDFVIASGYEVVSLDEARRRIRGEGPAGRFACFTFDDGYSDNFEHAYPIFRRRGLPFAIYVTTSYIDKKMVLWHYMLERLVLEHDSFGYRLDGQIHRFTATTPAEKESLYWELCGRIIACGRERWPQLFESLFAPHDIHPEQFHDQTMSWAQLETLAADPLVTIGAHTVNHFNLATLDEDEAYDEMLRSKQQLESRLGRPVTHFAYPFGKPESAGEREFRLAARCGFETATTTREGNLFRGHADHLMALPRIEISGRHQDLTLLDLRLSGALSILRNGLRRVVTN